MILSVLLVILDNSSSCRVGVYINAAGMPRSRISSGDNKDFLFNILILIFLVYYFSVSDDESDAI